MRIDLEGEGASSLREDRAGGPSDLSRSASQPEALVPLRKMRFAYADPPYLGRGEYYRAQHPDAMSWNDPETHCALIERLQADFPDGWVLSLSERSLRTILPMCPPEARVGAWITDRARYAGKAVPVRKHFEPVIFMGGRPYSDTGNRAADFIITKQERQPAGQPRYAMVKQDIRAGKIFVGKKPAAFARWVFELLGLAAGDELVDLFPGSGAISDALEKWRAQLSMFTGEAA
jgi:hypothetical protein